MITKTESTAFIAGEAVGVVLTKSYDISRGLRSIAHHEFFCKNQEHITEVEDTIEHYSTKAEWGRGSMKPLFEVTKRPASGDPAITIIQVLIASHKVYFELWHAAFNLGAPHRQAFLGVLLGYGVREVNEFVDTAKLTNRTHHSRKLPEIW